MFLSIGIGDALVASLSMVYTLAPEVVTLANYRRWSLASSQSHFTMCFFTPLVATLDLFLMHYLDYRIAIVQ
jgi:hypothetical protein